MPTKRVVLEGKQGVKTIWRVLNELIDEGANIDEALLIISGAALDYQRRFRAIPKDDPNKNVMRRQS